MAEIGKLTERLAGDADVEQRRAAASELRDAGFAARQSLEKRGTIGEPAESNLADHQLAALHAALEDDDPAVRRDAIIIAGDLGDASSVEVLIRNLDHPDEDIRLAAIDSLGEIGGTEGVQALTRLACNNDEDDDARLAALAELEELTAKRITSGPDRRFDPPDDPAAGETRDPRFDAGAEAKRGLAEACEAIEADAGAEDLLKLKAADVRAYLRSGIA
jgi:hypothetical protein